jgi:thioredoxin 1
MAFRIWLTVIITLCLVLTQQAAGEEVLIFSAKWCSHCIRLQNDLNDNLDVFDGYDWGYVDIDQEPELKAQYGVKTVPTVVVVDGVREVKRQTGYRNINALRAWLQGAKPEREVSHETIYFDGPIGDRIRERGVLRHH